MKLLFDQNLSRSLVRILKDLFPDSAHVFQFDMLEATDTAIWQLALAKGYAIVTKDGDYADRAAVARTAPKIIWIRLGNAPTSQVAALLRQRHEQVLAFESTIDDSVLGLP